MGDTDQLVRDYVLDQFKRSTFWKPPETYTHLKTCPDVTVTVTDQYSGSYDCDTCDYARIEADITCDHGAVYEYEVGEFGELPDLLDDIHRWAQSRT
jgi:hypothetical protein